MGGLGGAPGAYATNKKFKSGVDSFLFGSPEEHERVSTLLPEQQPLFEQLQAAGAGRGAGGAFGESGDYYRDLLQDNPELMEQFMAPEKRNFNENIIPGLSEQFAGMGAGGLSSSGFRNAAVGAGTDLSERLGAIRANLKNNAAQGLFNIGQQGLGNFSQDVITQQGTPGILSQLAPAAVSAGLNYATGGTSGLAQAGMQGMQGMNQMNPNRNSYGAPKVGGRNTGFYGNQGGMQMPNFMGA